jgi:hypothetical protein
MFNSLLGEKITNLKIHDLHTTDSEIYQPASMSNLKIYDFSEAYSQICELTDDETGNIVGGGKELMMSQCPCDKCRPEDPSNFDDNRPWQKGDPIIEPTGGYRLSNGELVMSRECSQ